MMAGTFLQIHFFQCKFCFPMNFLSYFLEYSSTNPNSHNNYTTPMTTITQKGNDAEILLSWIRLVMKFQLLQQKRFFKDYWRWNVQAKLEIKSLIMVLLHKVIKLYITLYNYIAIFHFLWVSALDFYSVFFIYEQVCFHSSPLATNFFLRKTELTWCNAVCLRMQWHCNSGAQWELWKCLFH